MPEDKPTQSIYSFDFWKLAIKWYFFPVLYIILAILFTLISLIKESKGLNDFEELGGIFLMTLYFLPNGLILLIEGFGSYVRGKVDQDFFLVFPIAFHIFWIASVGVIQFFKIKRDRIIRWLIITVFLAMILSFIGCTENLLVGKGFDYF